VALGNPLDPENEITELVWRFLTLCDRHIYDVPPSYLPPYLNIRLTLIKTGDEAWIDLKKDYIRQPL
jgi:lysylphosphatidylglycerol synthetase-like protein (DUF2156 family)